MHGRSVFHALANVVATLALIGLLGCATGPTVKPLATVATVTVESTGPVGSILQTPLGGGQIGQAARTVAGEVALELAVEGLQCGPLFIICSPIGALVGAGMGAILGGAEEAATTLPNDQAMALNAMTNDVLNSFDPRDALRIAAEDAVRAHDKVVEPAGAESTLLLEIGRLDWIVGAGNTVRPRIELLATVRWKDSVATRIYKKTGARKTVSKWTADAGALLVSELTGLFVEISAKIVADFDDAPKR